MNGSFDEVIHSPDNRSLKLIRSLRQRKMRDAERAFVVEGTRAVEDALSSGGNARLILVRAGSDWRPADGALTKTLRRVEPRVFDQHAETETPQPVMAVFEIPVIEPDERHDPLYLVVDGVRDPGNLGTLLRSAAAVDVTAVLVAHGTVDPFNGKVVRAGMGAHFRLPIATLNRVWQQRINDQCSTRVLADASAHSSYDQVEWGGAVALIVGSEARGPSEIGRILSTVSARIPLSQGVESLNAGVAGSVMLFEAARQRRARAEI